jgi:hypothetical protein
MRIGSAGGPGEQRTHQSTHVIYDARSGRIVATHHLIGAARAPEHRVSELVKDAHESSRVPLDHLAVLTDPDVPPGEGEVKVDHAAKRLTRSGVAPPKRIRP